MNETIWTVAISGVVLVGICRLMHALARRGGYVRLPEPDASLRDTRRDRLRYYAANALSATAGAAAGFALWTVPPVDAEGSLWHHSLFDDAEMRSTGPLLFAVAVGCVITAPVAERLIRPGPLLHILRRSSARYRMGDLDPRPVARWVGLGGAAIALLLHLGLRAEHTTFATDGVRWQSWPWQSEVEHRWQNVVDVRLVRMLEDTDGRFVEQPHLVLQFANGDELRLGRWNNAPAGYWEAPAAIASDRSGMPIRRVERE